MSARLTADEMFYALALDRLDAQVARLRPVAATEAIAVAEHVATLRVLLERAEARQDVH